LTGALGGLSTFDGFLDETKLRLHNSPPKPSRLHTTQSGFFFFDIEDVNTPLEGAHL